MLTDQKITVHSTTFNWRFETDINKFEISKSERFVKNLQRQVIIYALIIADVVTSKNELKSFDLFEDYLYLKNVFDNDLTEVLFEQDYNNHAIDLAENKKFSYMSLYISKETSWTSSLFEWYFN